MSAIAAELNYLIPNDERPRSLTHYASNGSPGTTVSTAPHTAFLPPDAPPGAPIRESIELQTHTFHKE